MKENYFNKVATEGIMKAFEEEVRLQYFTLRNYQAFREEFEGYTR